MLRQLNVERDHTQLGAVTAPLTVHAMQIFGKEISEKEQTRIGAATVPLP
jgi:hypothetical protein